MDHGEHGHFAKGNQASKGLTKPTRDERELREQSTLDMIATIKHLMETTPQVARELLQDPTTTYRERIVIRLLEQARVGDRDVQAIKMLLDRMCGPVKQKVELSGNFFDLASMTKEQKIELLNELRKSRRTE